jgi:serine/threonine-protein kinase
MVSIAGEVKLMDFGVARFSTEETAGINVKGKLRYMPPEQLQGMSREPTVDLFAAGAVLHEMLEGRRFRDDWDDLQLLTMIMNGLLEPNSKLRIGTARGALRMLTQWRGYRNAAIVLESYVTRLRDLVPPLPPTPSTGSAGDVQGRIAARAAQYASAQVGSGSQRSWRGVNPSTGTTLDQLENDAIDDTNVGSRSPSRAPRRMRGAAAVIAALGLVLAGMTVGIVVNASKIDGGSETDDVAEDVASKPESLKPEVQIAPPVPPQTAPAVTPPPQPTEVPAASEPIPPPAEVVLPADDTVETVAKPPPPPPKEKVKVTFRANDHTFVYVKVDREELVLEPWKSLELLEGGHTIYMRTDKKQEYQKLGRLRLRPGHDYDVLMTKPGGFKLVQVN